LKAEAARLMNVPCASKSSGANTGRAIGFRKLQAAARQAPPGARQFFLFFEKFRQAGMPPRKKKPK